MQPHFQNIRRTQYLFLSQLILSIQETISETQFDTSGEEYENIIINAQLREHTGGSVHIFRRYQSLQSCVSKPL